MIKPILQAAALCLVASFLASCAVAQMPMRMLQAMGRTVKMADNQQQPAPASTPIQIEQRELQDTRVPASINPTPAPAETKMENRVAAGNAATPGVSNPS